MNTPRTAHPSLRRLLSAMGALLFVVGVGCNTSETHWQEDTISDVTTGDTSSPSDTSTSQDTTVADTSEPDTTASDTTIGDTTQDAVDVSDTSASDTDTTSDTEDMADMLPDGDMVEPGPRLVVDDQVLSAVDQVVVREVEIEAAGWIVIYDTALGTGSDAIIGSLFLDGTELVSTEVVVTVDRPLSNGEALQAVLFVDAGQSGVFEPDTDDVPATDTAGDPVAAMFTVSYPAVQLDDQTVDLSTVVEVASVSLAGDGWLVLHPHTQMGGGLPDTSTVLAAVAVSGASTMPTRIVLSAPLPPNETQLWAALYQESGDDATTFEAGVDLAVVDLATTEPLVDDALITVPEGTAAVRITVLDADETTGMVLSAEPASLLTLDPTVAWPTLELEPGWRYEVFNPAAGQHPFEIVDDVNATVLLSQGTEGTLEGDADDINWTEDGDVARFTAAGGLPGVANAYRCGVHTEAGSGELMIAP